jgi:hypothetical protein
VTPGSHNRLPNGILGVLCRQHYPGFVTVGEGEDAREVLVITFDHYTLMIDLPNPTKRTFQNKAHWVVGEFWVSLPCNKLYFSVNRIN